MVPQDANSSPTVSPGRDLLNDMPIWMREAKEGSRKNKKAQDLIPGLFVSQQLALRSLEPILQIVHFLL